MEDQSTSDDFEDGDSRFECAICLQTCIQPVQLPCNHVFCYLCVKGIIHQSKRCAMCRQEIPPNFLDNPHLIQVHQSEVSFEDGYQWYYEGRNGWWQYDERTSAEIESAFERGSQECEVLIAGFLYVIDFQNLVQMRRSDLFRKRRIKRDLCSIPKKGVAGIRVQNIPVGKAQPKANDIVSEDPSHSNDPSTQDENRIFESGDILVSSSEPLDLSKSGSSSSKPLDLSKSGISSSKSLDISKEASEYGAVSKEPNESEKSPLPRRSRRQRK